MSFFQNLFRSKRSSIDKKQKVKISDFESVKEFWTFITQDFEWYLEYLPQDFEDIESNSEVLAPLIAKSTNELRYNLSFKKDDYWRVVQWDNIVVELKMENVLKQFCSNCKKEISIFQRYPRRICHECKSELKSSDGRNVEFFNSEALGYGCQGYYSGTNQTQKYDSTESYIGNKAFIADESRFGGIVIELKE